MTGTTAHPARGRPQDEPESPGGHSTGPVGRMECGDFGIRIGRDGTWFYHGSPIGRKPLVRLFASVLRREPDGSYWLVTPAERGRIAVEDAPFMAVEMRIAGSGRDQALTFRTNVDDEVTADAQHPIRLAESSANGEPSPYILVRDGLEARIVRSVYYDIVALGETCRVGGEDLYGVWSKGAFFPLGRAVDTG